MIITYAMAKARPCEAKDLWETPDRIYLPLRERFQFTLDPCCEIHTRKCEHFFTPSENGLLQSWKGMSCFVNPPYSRGNIDEWVEKSYEESCKPKTPVVGLLPVSTSSKWFHRWVVNKAALHYVEGRIRFKGAPHTAPFSSVIVVWGQSGTFTFKQPRR